jgi:hypothetical protein
MRKVFTTLLLGLLAAGAFVASDARAGARYSLADIQGGWWASCDAPAVEFYVKGDEYSGDFRGTYKLELTNGTLILKDGLVDGHSIDVTHAPIAFRIVSVSKDSLVLRLSHPSQSHAAQDWHLLSCK